MSQLSPSGRVAAVAFSEDTYKLIPQVNAGSLLPSPRKPPAPTLLCMHLTSTAAPHLQGLSARGFIPAQLSLLCSSSRSGSVHINTWLAQGRHLRNCFAFSLQASCEVHQLDVSLLQHCCCRCHTSPAPPCVLGVPQVHPCTGASPLQQLLVRLELRLQLLLGGHIEQADQYCGLIVHWILQARKHSTQPEHCLQLTSDGNCTYWPSQGYCDDIVTRTLSPQSFGCWAGMTVTS